MRNVRKGIAIFLIMILALSIVSPVKATSITINSTSGTNGQSETTSYQWYRFLNASINGSAVSYTFPATNTGLYNALSSLNHSDQPIFKLTKSGDESVYTVEIHEAFAKEGDTVANALKTITRNALATGTFSQTTPGGSVSSGSVDPGYYLIVSSLGEALVVRTLNDVTIDEKNSYPSVTKTGDKENAEIGEDVTYTVIVSIPSTVASKDIKLYDIASKGLTMNTSISVSGAAAEPAYTSATWEEDSSYSSTDHEKKYTLTIPAATVKANAGKTLTFSYSAKVNENAVVNVNETNKVQLCYDNYTTKDSSTSVKTFGFTLSKVNAQKAGLSGVEFTLTNGKGHYYKVPTNNADINEDRFVSEKSVVTTGSDGKIVFAGLGAGSYTLTETKALPGYHLLSSTVQITVSAEGNISISANQDVSLSQGTVEIINHIGTMLPATGGAGLYIVAGVAIVALLGFGGTAMLKRKVNGGE